MARVLPPSGFAKAKLHLHMVQPGLRFGRITMARDGAMGDLPIAEADIDGRRYTEIETAATLKMVDLRGEGPIIMGVPTDVAKATRQNLARAWSVAFHDHPEQPDGIIYPSRLNGHTNLAVFDIAIKKLKVVRVMKLIAAPGLAAVLNDLRVSIVAPD